MDNIILYLFKASSGMIIMYLFFLIVNRKDTFYKSNRVILLMSLILPVIFPLISISPLHRGGNLTSQEIFFAIASTADSLNIDSVGEMEAASLKNILFFSWLAVSLIFLVKILVSLFRTASIIRTALLVKEGFPGLVVTKEKVPPFSFYPFAVIPEYLYNNGSAGEIIEHEYTHIRQGHTFDVILCEMILAFFWFNPAVWFIRRSIILNHEFLADKNIVNRNNDVKEYQYQLLKVHTGLKEVSLANSFNSLIKNRIIMINKKPTPVIACLKNLLIIPVIAILFAAFSFTKVNVPSSVQNQEKIFSDESAVKLLKFIAENTSYPLEARSNKITGKIYTEIAMDKGGKIRKMETFYDADKIKSPLMQEVVIVGYEKNNSVSGNELAISKTPMKISGDKLSEECLRVSRLIESLDLPEWKDKELDFTLVINFLLK